MCCYGYVKIRLRYGVVLAIIRKGTRIFVGCDNTGRGNNVFECRSVKKRMRGDSALTWCGLETLLYIQVHLRLNRKIIYKIMFIL